LFRWVATILLAITLPVSLSADDLTFTAGVDRTQVAVGEQISLELTVAGSVQDLPEPSTPQIAGFQVFGAGRSQQFSFTNGVVSSSVTHRFVLTPQAEGSLIIPRQSLSYKGKTYVTSPIQITVTKGAARAPQQSQRRGQQSEQTSNGQSSEDDFFIETVVSKDTIYVNEQLTLTFRFYQGKRLYSEPEYKPPSATGFWVEDLPPQKNYYKNLHGRDYYVAEVKRALFPTSPGEKTIGSASLEIKGNDVMSLFDRDPFGFFERRRSSVKPVSLGTDPINVVVLPLPTEGKPVDFSGSVGNFKMSTSIDRTEVEVNQPVTVSIKLSGRGNIKTLAEPQIPDLPDFRVFNSGKAEDVSKAGYVVGGSKTFETTFVPKKPGTFTIPAVVTNYFDPESGEYKKLVGRDYEIKVAGVSNEEIASRSGVLPGRLALVATDIRFIITNQSGSDSFGGLYVTNPIFIFIACLPLIALGVVFAVRRHKDKLAGDVGYRRLRHAVKTAQKHLAVAGSHLDKNEADQFYTEVSRALYDYIGDKFNLSAHGLTEKQMKTLFSEKKATEETQSTFFGIVSTCDEGRFTPSSHEPDVMRGLLQRAQEWIVNFEQNIK